jgi:type II secretory pathway pseudopilin PulG
METDAVTGGDRSCHGGSALTPARPVRTGGSVFTVQSGRGSGPVSDRSGFSAVELVFVAVVAGLLVSIAVPSFRAYSSHRDVVQARDALARIAARARAAAVERKGAVVLTVRTDRDALIITSEDGGDTLEVVDFVGGDTPAEIVIEGPPQPLRLCFTSQGFVHPICGAGASLPRRVGLAARGAGADTVWAMINAVGQVELQ